MNKLNKRDTRTKVNNLVKKKKTYQDEQQLHFRATSAKLISTSWYVFTSGSTDSTFQGFYLSVIWIFTQYFNTPFFFRGVYFVGPSC